MTHTLINYTESQKKIKGVRGLAQEAQPSDLYPYARKSDTWVQKKSSKNSKKSLFILKSQSGSRKKLVLILNSVLEDILIYHLRLKESFYLFFFLKKMFEKTTSVNFVGSDPRLLEIGAK